MAPPQHPRPLWLLARLFVALTVVCAVGCSNTPDYTGPPENFSDLATDIPLPNLGPNPGAPEHPGRIHAIVQRIDVPLDQSTDDAWAVTDELVFPAITRSIWHANGLRLGFLGEADVQPFALHMPNVLELFETQVYTSSHPVAVMRTPRLRNDIRIPVDLTLPPGAPHNETILGGEDGKLQLLARLEVEDGKTYIVLTPHHAKPEPGNLQPRDILERELDGRVYDELSIRVELTSDRLLVVGLYWPWPIGEAFEDPDDNLADAALPELEITWLTQSTGPLADDPAAPPRHLRQGVPDRPENVDGDNPEDTDAADETPEATPREPASIRRTRIAPPLPLHFGRALLTGTRARKPVQTFLLISIPAQDNAPVAPSIEDLNAQPAHDAPNDLASSPATSD